jgi:hypothetical protein
MTVGRDAIAGLVCLAISIWLLVLTIGLPPAIMVPLGPAVYPRIVLGITALLSLMLIAGDLLRHRRSGAPTAPSAVRAGEAVAAPTAEAESLRAGPTPTTKPNYALVFATFALFGSYVLLLPWLGFRIATFLFVVALQPILQWPRSWWHWLLVLAVAVATTLVCFYVFEDYLAVLLPRGHWTGM